MKLSSDKGPCAIDFTTLRHCRRLNLAYNRLTGTPPRQPPARDGEPRLGGARARTLE
jgi:hypothetical protein